MKIGDVWGHKNGKPCGAQKVIGFDFAPSTPRENQGVSFHVRDCRGRWRPAVHFRRCVDAKSWEAMQQKARRVLLNNEGV